ncbi:MAG: hypothetical protein S4CHLAM102_03150 [Chlamydiia bacterium]|nr:hypothetical protein [Chlamydiia bacterium]
MEAKTLMCTTQITFGGNKKYSEGINMDFSYYDSFFHDGNIFDISQVRDTIVISMCSAQISAKENRDNLRLDPESIIRGKLHIEGITDVLVDEQKFAGALKKEYDSGNIIRLDISDNCIELVVSWHNFPPKPTNRDCNSYRITGMAIGWENTPSQVE